jgi:hypothetical protein
MIIAVAFAFIAVSSSAPSSPVEQNALARFYSGFAQLYRPPSVPMQSQDSTTTQRYQFLFTDKEFENIKDESLSLLYTTVIERSIIYHPMPNFEVEGTRYFYRRDPKDAEAVEIELVRVADKLFREVQQSNRYFYLPTYSTLEYTNRVPLMPYYEVNFICNISSLPRSADLPTPLLSYMDKTFSWSPRYTLDLPMLGNTKKPEMFAYADLQNIGEQSMTLKAAELIAGDIRLIELPVTIIQTGMSDAIVEPEFIEPSPTQTIFYADDLGEQANGAKVFQLRVPSGVVLPPHSTTSVPFFEPHVNIDAFFSYSSLFTTVNAKEKLFKAYNITSLDIALPAGRLMLHEQGRFMGELDLPELAVGEVYTMQFGYDAEVAYRRKVKILQGDEESNTVTYNVEITFENLKPTRDIFVDCTESFSEYKYFEVTQISMNNNGMPDLNLYGSDLRGHFPLQQRNGRKVISYNVTVHKVRPVHVAPVEPITIETGINTGMNQIKPVSMAQIKTGAMSQLNRASMSQFNRPTMSQLNRAAVSPMKSMGGVRSP